MVLKLYGWFASTPALFVALILHEKQVPFEWIEVDLTRGEQKTSEYLSKNPFGQIPTIDDDGFMLYESRAIARYIDEKYPDQGTQLYPSDVKIRAKVDQAVWAGAYHFSRFGFSIATESLNNKFFGRTTDFKILAEETKSLLQRLDVYENILSKQKYLAGDEISVADLVHIPMGSRLLEETNIKIGEGRPNVLRWLNELINRESWQKVKPILRSRL